MREFLLNIIFLHLFFLAPAFALPSESNEMVKLNANPFIIGQETLERIPISPQAHLYIRALLFSEDPVSKVFLETGKFLKNTGQEQLMEDLQRMIQTELEKPLQMRSFIEIKKQELQEREQKIKKQDEKAQTKQEKKQIKEWKKQIEKEMAQVEIMEKQVDQKWENIVIAAVEKFFKQHEYLFGESRVKGLLKRIKKIPTQILKNETEDLRGFLREVGIDTSKKESLQKVLERLREGKFSSAKNSLLGKDPLRIETLVFGVPVSDKETLQRILLHFKLIYKPNDFLSYANRVKYFNQSEKGAISSENWSRRVSLELKNSLFSEGSPLIHSKDVNQITHEFAAITQEGYGEPLDDSTRKAINLLHRILRAERIGEKEVRIFRDILEILKLPPEFYSNEYIRHYLSATQMEEIQKLYKTVHIEYRQAVTDKDALFLLSKIKKSFVKPHYDLLKDQTKFGNFIRGFPIQMLIYHVSVGAVIFLEHFLTDRILYQSYKNPIPMETWMQGLLPEAWFSLGVFIYAASHVQFQVHKFGAKKNSNLLKAMAAPAGMTAGYLLSMAIMEVVHDRELHKCAEKMVKRHQENKHITSCEAAALKWESKLFVDLGPDIATLLGAGWLSQKILSRMALWMRMSKLGNHVLAGAASRLGWAAIPVHGVVGIMGFLILNEVMDRYGTKWIKEWRFKNKVKSGIARIQYQLTGEPGQLSGPGQFTVKPLKYEMDKVKDNLSAMRVENPRSTRYNDFREENAGIIQNLQERWKALTQEVKELDFNFDRWVDVKGLSYFQIFQSWKMQTEKLIQSFKLSETLLREIYGLSHKSQIGLVNKYRNELIKKRNRQLEALTREYIHTTTIPEGVFQVCKTPINSNLVRERINALSMEYKNDKSEGQGEERRTAAEIYISRFMDICFRSLTIIHHQSKYDAFSFSEKTLNSPRFIQTAKSVCANYKEYMVLLDLKNWISFCESSVIEKKEERRNDKEKYPIIEDTILLISYILNSPEFAHLDEVQIDDAEKYIGWEIDGVLSRDKKISSLFFTEKLAIARRLLNPVIHQHLEEMGIVDIDKIKEKLSPKYSIALDEKVKAEWLHAYCKSESISVPDLLCPETANVEIFIKKWVQLNDNPHFVQLMTEGMAEAENMAKNNRITTGIDSKLSEKIKIYRIITDIDSKLSEKIKVTGFYFFKEAVIGNLNLYRTIGAMADPIEVYKKGEHLLNPYSEQNARLHSLYISPEAFYLSRKPLKTGIFGTNPDEDYSAIAAKNKILHALICGTEEGKISNDFLLIPPKIFTGAESLCENLSAKNPDSFSGDLFRDPVFANGKRYETAYLALEELVRDRYDTEEDLMDQFKNKTSHLKEEAYQGVLKDLDNLVEQFLISNLIPAEKTFKGSCSDLKAYYESEKDFSGLEISLMQINHNLNQLKILKELGVEYNLNREKQDDIHCEVLNLLQGWYSNYVDNTSLNRRPAPLTFPEESFLKELMTEGMAEAEKMAKAMKEGNDPYRVSLKESFIRKIQNRYHTVNLTYIDKGFLFYDILREFAPEYNDAETVKKKIEYGNDQFKGSVNQQFANWEPGWWRFASPLVTGIYKTLTDRSEEEIQEIAGEAIEEQTCDDPLTALILVIQGEINPHYTFTFPPVQAPMNENCKLGFDDERDRTIYSALVSLYNSLDRFYSSFGFLAQTQKLKSDFER